VIMRYRPFVVVMPCAILVFAGACGDNASPTVAPMARYTLEHDGLEREYFVFLPSNYKDGHNLPVALFMHGYGGTATATEAEVTNGLTRYAEQYGYVMVFPQSTWFMSDGPIEERWEVTSWNHVSDGFDKGPAGPICTEDATPALCPPECGTCGKCGWSSCHDDVGFLKELVSRIASDFAVDTNRVYVSGFSNGAMMANRIACEASELFAAVALVGGRVEPGFDGRVSDGGYFYASTDSIAEHWNNGAACVTEQTAWSSAVIDDETVRCTIACAGSGNESISCLWPEGEHRWPGTSGFRGSNGHCVTELQAKSMPEKTLCIEPDFDQDVWGSRLMFEFFDRHRGEQL